MNGQNQKKSDTDGLLSIAFCVAAAALFAYFLWKKFHIPIATFQVIWRNILLWPLFELYVFLTHLLGTDIPLIRQLFSNTIELCGPTSAINIVTTCTRDFSSISYKQLGDGALFGNIVLGLGSLFIAYKGYERVEKNHPKVKFGKIYSLESFMQEQKQNHPHLNLYADLNLQDVSSNYGPLMGMKTTREFAKEHKLITTEAPRVLQYISKGITQSEKDIKDIIPLIDREKLITVLRKQLGSIWVGVENITDLEAILIARYLPVACSTDSKMSDEEFYRIKNQAVQLEAEFWRIAVSDILESDQFKPIGTDKDGFTILPDGDKSLSNFNIEKLKTDLILPYINHPVARKLLSQHAYTRTFIIGLVFTARKLGVAAPTQMRWIKFYNREMWALLSNIGRPSFFCENMGSPSHYQAEAVAKEMILQPHFDVAIRGFEHQIQSYLYTHESIQNLKIDEGEYKEAFDWYHQLPDKTESNLDTNIN